MTEPDKAKVPETRHVNIGGHIQRKTEEEKRKKRPILTSVILLLIVLIGASFTPHGKAFLTGVKDEALETTEAAAKVRPRKIPTVDGASDTDTPLPDPDGNN